MIDIETDARRYVWCRSNALWVIGMPALTFLQDVHGAQEAAQEGLLRYAARGIGDACAVALHVVVNQARPIPPAALRTAWALEGIRDHALWEACWQLVRGIEAVPANEIPARCEALIAEVQAIVGKMPNILTPEGHYPAIALARDWAKLLDAVGEPAPLPSNWALPS